MIYSFFYVTKKFKKILEDFITTLLSPFSAMQSCMADFFSQAVQQEAGWGDRSNGSGGNVKYRQFY
jgi:hypothetical protein